MRLLHGIFLLSLLVPAGAVQPRSGSTGPVVQLAAGRLRGSLRGSLAVFSGIPYAAPPVGPLRWREPQPVAPWSGVRDATRPGSSCAQSVDGLNPFISPLAALYGVSYKGQPVPSSEDCLYLNVWTPSWPVKGALPVMVWLHGGSNTAGSGAQPTYDGTSLVAHGVILVTINYRLGVLGFFSHPELTRESPHHSSGNYGLLDQFAALHWVRQNIAQFGGDPGNVTLFGESAGSIDAGMLLVSPLSTGLFRRVILESGPPFGLGKPRPLADGEAFGAAVGKAAPGKSQSGLENLRALPPDEVVKLAAKVQKEQFKDQAGASYFDGWLLSQAPARTFAIGTMQKADVMVGLNGRELSAFRAMAPAAPKTADKPAAGSAFQTVGKAADGLRPLYGSWTDATLALYLAKALFNRTVALDQAANDTMLACPIGALSSLMTAGGQRAYVYKFDRSIPGRGESALGAFHGLEVPFVFNAFADPSWNWLPFTGADRQLSATIEMYWTNFAKTGNPNSPGLPNWSAWTSDDEPFMEFTHEAQAVPRKGFSPHFCYLSPDRLKRQLADQ